MAWRQADLRGPLQKGGQSAGVPTIKTRDLKYRYSVDRYIHMQSGRIIRIADEAA
ncbi:Tfp pilus assembly protein PilP [Bradyrhizobium sp. AZCC 2262]